MGKFSEKLDKRLQEHIRMLKQNEGSLSGTNTVLEYDSAKAKTDKLVEIIRAKVLWKTTYKDIQDSDKTDQNEMYRKLVILQKSYEVLSKVFFSLNRFYLLLVFRKSRTRDEFRKDERRVSFLVYVCNFICN